MARQKQKIVIGLTTFSHEFLRISVAGLARLSKNSILIIYNDNPCRPLKHRTIRKLGFRGQLHIINTDENVGHIRARIAILDYVNKNKIDAPWFVFANDDDIVLNIDVPQIENNIFAIMGNAVVIRQRVLDVLRVMDNPDDYTIDGVDTQLYAPHIALAGTFIRTKYAMEFGEFLSSVTDSIADITRDVPFVIPVDAIMWNMFVEYMRQSHPEMSPIYMNQTNYLMTKLNNSCYPTNNQRDGLVARATAIVAAAPRGNE